MLIYEFKERKQNSGECLYNEGGYKVTEYKTGFAEFMVTNISCSTTEKTEFAHKFSSPSIAIVLSGSGQATFGEEYRTVTIEEKTPYYIMPNEEFKITSTGSEELSIFICSCDV